MSSVISARYMTWAFERSLVDFAPVHEPVMVEEVLEALRPEKGRFFLDATCGTGGHSLAIAERISSEAVLVSNDWDRSVLEIAKERLLRQNKQIVITNFNFASLNNISAASGIRKFDGVLADLGLSSFQLDDPRRGFSFQSEGILDMRMSDFLSLTARELVNTLSEQELARIISTYGEEKKARRIARAIVKRRAKQPISTTRELAEIIEKLGVRRGRIHPATRTFQALRIAVNDELGNLERFLSNLPQFVAPGARVVIISFHSLEDRLVKRAFKAWAKEKKGRVLFKKPLRPSKEEVSRNPRARSAKLRSFIFESER